VPAAEPTREQSENLDDCRALTWGSGGVSGVKTDAEHLLAQICEPVQEPSLEAAAVALA